MDSLLFDLDGTLLNSRGNIIRCLNVTLNEFDVEPFRPDEFRPLIGMHLWKIFELKGVARQEVVDRYRKLQMSTYKQDILIYEGVPDMLETLKRHGYLLGVVTMRLGVISREILGGLGLMRHFDDVVGADDTSEPKPLPGHILTACKRLGVRPENAAMIGDTMYDMSPAKKAGCTAVGVTWGNGTPEELREAGADHIVDTVADLEILLLKL